MSEVRVHPERKVTDKLILDTIEAHEGENLTVRILGDMVGFHSSSSVHYRLKKLEQAGLITIKSGTFITVNDEHKPKYPGGNNAEQHIERLEHLLLLARRHVKCSRLRNAEWLLREIEQLVLEPPKGGE